MLDEEEQVLKQMEAKQNEQLQQSAQMKDEL